MNREALKTLLEKHGQKYSQTLGIKLETAQDSEIFKWFLAAMLFGAPISETPAMKTYKCFEKHNFLTSDKILRAGWNRLVQVLDEGGYTRYDYKTADKLLLVMGNLQKEYRGSLNLLQAKASNSADLEKRLKALGKGIGDVTVNIFLRDLRDIWNKADSKPTPLMIIAARDLKIAKSEDPQKALEELKAFWIKNQISGFVFADFETALLRYGKELRRRNRE